MKTDSGHKITNQFSSYFVKGKFINDYYKTCVLLILNTMQQSYNGSKCKQCTSIMTVLGWTEIACNINMIFRTRVATFRKMQSALIKTTGQNKLQFWPVKLMRLILNLQVTTKRLATYCMLDSRWEFCIWAQWYNRTDCTSRRSSVVCLLMLKRKVVRGLIYQRNKSHFWIIG